MNIFNLRSDKFNFSKFKLLTWINTELTRNLIFDYHPVQINTNKSVIGNSSGEKLTKFTKIQKVNKKS